MEVWIGRDGERHGPYKEVDVRQWLRTGQVSAQDLGWYEGMADWQPLSSLFPDDVRAHEAGTCSLRHDVLVPKIVDLTPDGFLLDELHRLKRPDWTYADGETPRART